MPKHSKDLLIDNVCGNQIQTENSIKSFFFECQKGKKPKLRYPITLRWFMLETKLVCGAYLAIRLRYGNTRRWEKFFLIQTEDFPFRRNRKVNCHSRKKRKMWIYVFFCEFSFYLIRRGRFIAKRQFEVDYWVWTCHIYLALYWNTDHYTLNKSE